MITQSALSPLLRQPIEFTHADPAHAATGPRLHVGIFTGVLMALRAMRLACVLMRTVLLGILLVLTGSAPIQVFQMIVVGIIVAMQSPHSWRSFSNECRQDKAVNRRSHPLSVDTQTNLPVCMPQASISTSVSGLGWSQNLALNPLWYASSIWDLPVQRSDPAMIGYGIPGKIRRGQPSLIAAHNGQSTLLHGRTMP